MISHRVLYDGPMHARTQTSMSPKVYLVQTNKTLFEGDSGAFLAIASHIGSERFD